MQRNGIPYILGFCVAICLFCALFVSSSAVGLKDKQTLNKELDMKSKVLTVAGIIEEGVEVAPDDLQAAFRANIKAVVVTLKTGELNEELTKTAATYDQKKASKDPELGVEAPKHLSGVKRIPKNALVYMVCQEELTEENSTCDVAQYILPVEGKGLWSTMYGFVALAPDFNEIKGLTFYQHGETPGLGGEVDNPGWKKKWIGRQVFGEPGSTPDQWSGVKVRVIKGSAGAPDEDPYQVDGLSGATITSNGVTYLLQFWLGENGFGPFIEGVLKKSAG